VTVSDAAWAAIDGRSVPIASFYANLKVFEGYYEKKWFPYTMPISDIYGLRAAFDNIAGDPDMLARHARIGEARRAGVPARGLSAVGLNLHLASGFSNTVTVFDVPKETTADAILQTMRQKHGIMLAGSFDSLAGQVIRIGHMGSNANVVDMIETLDALDDTLRELNVPLKGQLRMIFQEEVSKKGLVL